MSWLAFFLPCAFAQNSSPVLIGAAADLARTQGELSESFAKASGYRAQWVFSGSGTLARQIENGAPYDVYLSANEDFVRKLATAGKLLQETVRPYARGRLGLWSRTGKIRTVQDLLDAGVRHVAIANPVHAPYGAAAQEALRKTGLWDKLAGKIVYGENVRQALQFAETGNADAAITAWSLVFDRGGVQLPSAWHSPIRQIGGVVAGSRNPRGAAAFLDFLTGQRGREVLSRYGFE